MNDVIFTAEDFDNLGKIEEFNKTHWKGTGQSLGWNYDVPRNNSEIAEHREALRNIKTKLEQIQGDLTGKPQFKGLVSDVQKITDSRINKYLHHIWLYFVHGIENRPPNEPQLQLTITPEDLNVSLWFENAYSIKKYFGRVSELNLDEIKNDPELALIIYQSGTSGDLIGRYRAWEDFNQQCVTLNWDCKIGLTYVIPKERVLNEKGKVFNSISDYFDRLLPLFNTAKASGERFVVAHIEWNDFGWTKPQIPDKPSFGYTKEGNVPHDSLNFKFDKPIDTNEKVYGYFQPGRGNPTGFIKSTDKKIIFFLSRKMIVGIYGNAEYYEKRLSFANNDFKEGRYNADISGDKDMSFGFIKDCYLNAKPEYMNGKRMGRSNFIYVTQQNAEKLLQDILKTYEKFLSNNPQDAEAKEHVAKLNKLMKALRVKDQYVESSNQGVESLIEKKKQIILYGPPGTGKTFITRNLALNIIEGSTKDHE